jgi:hypothetical protein
VTNYEVIVPDWLIMEDESEYPEEFWAVSKQSGHLPGGTERDHRTS